MKPQLHNNHSADASVLCLSYLYKLKHLLSGANITLHMEPQRKFIHHWNKNSTKFWRKKNATIMNSLLDRIKCTVI
jgi:hypothetical protein